MIPRLKEKYNSELSGEIQKELNLSNINQIPTLEKIIINIGDGKAALTEEHSSLWLMN